MWSTAWSTALDIAAIAADSGRELGAVAAVHFAVGARLRLAWLRDLAGRLPSDGHWQALARAAARDELADLQSRVTAAALAAAPAKASPDAVIAAWESSCRPALEGAGRVLGEIEAAGGADLSTLTVALWELRALA